MRGIIFVITFHVMLLTTVVIGHAAFDGLTIDGIVRQASVNGVPGVILPNVSLSDATGPIHVDGVSAKFTYNVRNCSSGCTVSLFAKLNGYIDRRLDVKFTADQYNNHITPPEILLAMAPVYSPAIINGRCGDNNGKTLTTKPTNNLCAINGGDQTPVNGSGPWDWRCTGRNGGTSATCKADIQTWTVNAVVNSGSVTGTVTCGPSQANHGTSSTCTISPAADYQLTAFIDNNASLTGVGGNYVIANVTSNHSIAASFGRLLPISTDGHCGSAHNSYFTVAPNTDLCSSGSASPRSVATDRWNWNCAGAYGGSTELCWAYAKIAPSTPITWYHNGDGTVSVQTTTGVPAATVYQEKDSAWHIVGRGDFDGDGVQDYVWWNSSTGQAYIMLMSSPTVVKSGRIIISEPNTDWRIVATADLNGDGMTDLIWWNQFTGQVYALLLNGTALAGGSIINIQPDTNWKIVAVADFNGDSKMELLWWNSSTGEVALGLTDGLNASTSTIILTEPNTDWRIAGTGDLYGDGTAEIIWHNRTTGQVYGMKIHGTSVSSGATIYTEPNTQWELVSIGYYNSDNSADLLWWNQQTGQVYLMPMNGLSVAPGAALLSTEPDTTWHILGETEWRDTVYGKGVTTTTYSPEVTEFSIPYTPNSLTVPVVTFTAKSGIAYLITEAATPPSATTSGWSAAPPASYTFGSAGLKSLYAWVKDAAGNVSPAKRADTVAVNLTGNIGKKALLIIRNHNELPESRFFFESEAAAIAGYLAEVGMTTDIAYGFTTTLATMQKYDLVLFDDVGRAEYVPGSLINDLISYHKMGRPLYFIGDDLAYNYSISGGKYNNSDYYNLIGLEPSSENGVSSSYYTISPVSALNSRLGVQFGTVGSFSYFKDPDQTNAKSFATSLMTYNGFDAFVVYQDGYGKVATQNYDVYASEVIISDTAGLSEIGRMFKKATSWLMGLNSQTPAITWLHQGDGKEYGMTTNGSSITGGAQFWQEPDPAWAIVGQGDFDGDGIRDFVWWNSSTGQVYIMLMAGPTATKSGATIYTEANTNWRIAATGDVNGDGITDLIWWNRLTGQVSVMPVNGTTAVTGNNSIIYTEPDTNWRIVAAADFNGNGKAELLWWNSSSGQVAIGQTNGTNASTANLIWTEPNTDWRIAGAGDLDDDGKAEIVWHNKTTGQVYGMQTNGTSVTNGAMMYTEPNTNWEIVSVGNYNSDNKAELLWWNQQTGQVFLLPMNGLSVAPGAALLYTEPDTTWHIQGETEWRNNLYGKGVTTTSTTLDVTAFSIPYTPNSLTVPVYTFTAKSGIAYMITESATPPSATASGWSATPQSSYTFTSAGLKTLYAWAKDAKGNVSSSKSANTIAVNLIGDIGKRALLIIRNYTELPESRFFFESETAAIAGYLAEIGMTSDVFYGFTIPLATMQHYDLVLFDNVGRAENVPGSLINDLVSYHKMGRPLYFIGDDLAFNYSGSGGTYNNVDYYNLIGLEPSSDNGVSSSYYTISPVSTLNSWLGDQYGTVASFSYFKDPDQTNAQPFATPLMTYSNGHDAFVIYKDAYGKVATQNYDVYASELIISDAIGLAEIGRMFKKTSSWLIR